MRIQKGKPRFSKRELWNLDETLKPILHTALVQFRDSNRHGFPTMVYADYIAVERGITIEAADLWIKENMNSCGDLEGYDLNKMVKFFDTSILADMIFAFSNHPDYDEIEDAPFKISMNVDDERDENGNRRSFIETKLNDGVSNDDYFAYIERQKAYDEGVAARCERGRHLFARYFEALWD